jgi:2-keto-4-pentenoate hydratase
VPDIERSIDRLWEIHASGEALPARWNPPLDFAASLRVQLGILDRKLAGGAELAGWKMGLTSARVRERLGTEDQPFGYLLASGVQTPGGKVSLDSISPLAGIENELCFTMAETLPAEGVTPVLARKATRAVAAGMEINELRTDGKDFGLLVADGLAQWGIVPGPEQPLDAAFNSDDVRTTLSRNGEVQSESLGRDVIDDHFISLAVLANTLGRFGRRLEAGQKVITGSFSNHKVRETGHWAADFGPIGSVDIHFV